MRVTYLKHSGFAVECKHAVLVFDYYRGELPEFSKEKKLYVFSSHAHYDHFQKKIFAWDKMYDTTYILSDDIEIRASVKRILSVGVNQKLQADDLEIHTFTSTDEGVAFLVKVEGKTIYHAGDLNWWHWEEESEAYNEGMKRNYQQEISKLEGEVIDLAFVVLDPRQEKQFLWGLDYFMRHTDTKVVVPMHMWEQYETLDKCLLCPEVETYRDKIVKITKPQQEFAVD